VFHRDEHSIYRARSLDALGWIEHGFGTRHTTLWQDDPRVVALHQIHSNACVVADGQTGRIGEGDALVTAEKGVLLTVRTADCIPILLADERRRIVAAIHAGWRGTLQDVVAAAIGSVGDRFGSRPSNLLAAIGPGIGVCCYEVGAEVASQFKELFPERHDLDGRTRLDLAEANRRRLLAAGIPAERIAVAGLCTCCGPEEFHSFRRDRADAGRMTAAIGIRA
jgi:purine-nucleoside/S-methyl-5'-thioadenosine phosphorylase / adenosine deaminase